MSSKLLIPFRRWFRAPVVDTPFSTISVPSVWIVMSIIFISFSVITSGFVFCVVRGMPVSGPIRGKDGKPVLSWIDVGGGISNQFLGEGIIAAIVFSLSASSFIASYYILTREPTKGKPEEVNQYLRKFAFTSPLWCFLSYHIFTWKLGSFSIKFWG